MAAAIKSNTARPASDIRRLTIPLDRTEILVNVYDLLPPGKLASLLWCIGTPLLHTGVVIKRWNKEFAFGGHDTPGVSGIYATQPQQEPPGGAFRRELFQGVTFRTDDELGSVLDEAAQKFQGTSYDLLNCNCNHFTSFLCVKLTNKAPPGWLNRAARIALTMPCVVPRDWLTPSDYASADGGLLNEEEEDDGRAMLWDESNQPYIYHEQLSMDQNDRRHGEHCRRCGDHDNSSYSTQDNSGRTLPISERAPLPIQL